MKIESLLLRKYARKILLKKLAWVPICLTCIFFVHYYYIDTVYNKLSNKVGILENNLKDYETLKAKTEETKIYKNNQQLLLSIFKKNNIKYSKFLSYVSKNIPNSTWVYEIYEFDKNSLKEESLENINKIENSEANKIDTNDSKMGSFDTTSNESKDENIIDSKTYSDLEKGKKIIVIRGASTSSGDIGLMKIKLSHYNDTEYVKLINMQQTIIEGILIYVYEMHIGLKDSGDTNEQ